MASAKTIRNLLLPVETVVHDKLLLAKSVCVILFSAEAGGRITCLGRKPFFEDDSLGRSTRLRTVSAEAKYDTQSLQEAKLDGLLYSICVAFSSI